MPTSPSPHCTGTKGRTESGRAQARTQVSRHPSSCVLRTSCGEKGATSQSGGGQAASPSLSSLLCPLYCSHPITGKDLGGPRVRPGPWGQGKAGRKTARGAPGELGVIFFSQGCPGAEVTLCILGSPSTFLSVLLEAGVQSPGECVPKFPHPLLRKGQPCPGPATSQNTRRPWQQPAFHWTSCPAPEAGSGGGWVLGAAAPYDPGAQAGGGGHQAFPGQQPSSLPTGNMLLCLSPAWLTKVPAPGQPGEAALLVSKAVSFHPGGLTFLDDFVPPRRATYFLAGLGLGPGWGREAAELARDLTCPTGASAELARLLEDRLLTRRLLAQQGNVAVPATLAFTYKPPAPLRGGDASPGLRLVELNGKEGQETLVKEEVGAFLHSEALGDALQVTGSCP